MPLVDREVEKAIYELIQRYPRHAYRRFAMMLRRKKVLVVNREKVRRIMKRNGRGVRSLTKGFRPRVPASRSVSAFVNQRWARDMTHFFCKEAAWCHLIVVMDCWKREIIGYRVSKRQDSKVAERAPEDALIRRFGMIRWQAHGVILRSDNGLIFSSKRYMKLVHRYGLAAEYITPYSPEQNGAIERFMRTLKDECFWLNSFTAFRDAKSVMESWIGEYNRDRPHQELGYSATGVLSTG